MVKRRLVFLALILSSALATLPTNAAPPAPASDIQSALDGHFDSLVKNLRTGNGPCTGAYSTYCGGLAAGNPQALYNTQIVTTTLLLYLRAQLERPASSRDPGTAHMLDEMSRLYAVAFDSYLTEGVDKRTGQHYHGWLGSAVADRTVGVGSKNTESILPSVQFAFSASRVIRLITQLPAAERTAAMTHMLGQVPYLAETYQRWIEGEQAAALGSQFGVYTYTRPDGSQKRTTGLVPGDPSYSLDPGEPTVPAGDVGLEAAAGIAELTAAADSGAGAIPAATRKVLDDFLAFYWRERFVGRGEFAPGPRDRSQETWVWDRNLNTRHSSPGRFLCAKYQNPRDKSQPPASVQDCLAADPDGAHFPLDISHYTKVPDAAESFRQRPELRAETERILRGIAQEILQVVWNGDAVKPRWTNYADGTDGWFGVRFSPPYVAGLKGGDRGVLVPGTAGMAGPGQLAPQALPLLARYMWLVRYDPAMACMAEAIQAAYPAKFKWRSADRQSALSLIPMEPRYLLPGT